MIDFLPHEILLPLAAGAQRVIVAPDALLFWWGADSGPQTAEGLVAQHLAEIEAAVVARRSEGRSHDDVITIGEDDLD